MKYLWLALLILAAFLTYSHLYRASGDHFNSPDEAAVYFFTNLLSNESTLKYSEPLNQSVEGQIHPRSMLSVNNYLVPITFPGILVILGLFAKLTSIQWSIYLIPMLSAIAPLLYYSLIRRLFDSKIAWISAFLFYLHPAFIYYSNRNFLPNVLFLDLFIIGLWFLWRAWADEYWKQNLFALLGGLMLALALWVRAFEIIWVIPFIAILLINPLTSFSKGAKLWYAFIPAAVIFGLFLLVNQNLYGHVLSTGYYLVNAPRALPENQAAQSTIDQGTETWLDWTIEGIQNIASHFYYYYLFIFFWLSIPLILGIILARKEWGSPNQKIYFWLFIAVSLILIIFYGNWNFYDNINKDHISIGNSYTRYFLPSYILALPFIALFLLKISQGKRLYLALWSTAIIVPSLMITFHSEEGLNVIKNHLQDYEKQRSIVIDATPPNAVILCERCDKIFFPDRKIMIVEDSNRTRWTETAKTLTNHDVPLYFYTEMTDADIDFLNNGLLIKSGLALKEPLHIQNNFRLWKIQN
ncbi:MAG: glycosyltransferase family 39 protein [Parcubacteria group bacterium]|nr:glycosyltransferase family 39 protein [Parcubacteria group bacterium]